MDSNLTAALVGLLGGLIGVVLGATIQRRHSLQQLKIDTTLHLYDRFDEPDILSSRMRAYEILEENKLSPKPRSMSQLDASLNVEEWLHITRTRRFFERMCDLLEARYLEPDLARRFFRRVAFNWYDRYFDDLDRLDKSVEADGGPKAADFHFHTEDVHRLLA